MSPQAATLDAGAERVATLFEHLPELIDANSDLVRRGRFLTTDFAIVIGTVPLLVRVEAGRLRRRLVEYYASEGIADPVRIQLPRGTYAVDYHFACAAEQAQPQPAPVREETAAVSQPWRYAALVLAALFVAAVGVIAWQQSALREAEKALAAIDEPQRTEWPRIVVVPFENLSAEPELDAFAASITEEIMLRLDRLDLFVVASQASWYGPSADAELDATAEAGGYVLTGSLRGTGEHARIAARLIEAETGAQLWTSAYDEPLTLEHLPALQARIAHDVVAIAAPYGPIFEAELNRARRPAHAPKLSDCNATYHEYRRRVTPTGYTETLDCLRAVSATRGAIRMGRVCAATTIQSAASAGSRPGIRSNALVGADMSVLTSG